MILGWGITLQTIPHVLPTRHWLCVLHALKIESSQSTLVSWIFIMPI